VTVATTIHQTEGFVRKNVSASGHETRPQKAFSDWLLLKRLGGWGGGVKKTLSGKFLGGFYTEVTIFCNVLGGDRWI